MKSDWWKHLKTEDAKAERKRLVENSKLMREAMLEILQAKLTSRDAQQISQSAYDSPSWAYLQADSNGYKRAVVEMIDLLTIEDKQ